MRALTRLTGLACLVGLGWLFFGPVLFKDHQFGYRDAAHYYYPLYERVQQEWNAGRIPLWEPEENAGMPLLGNPTAAVLYPLKLIYTFAPSYAWGARLYILAHVLISIVTLYACARAWSISPIGSSLAAMAYGFGAPVVFQSCNVIFLVGAAWAPLGFWAVDRWLTLRHPRALIGLALVLCLQTLGGDPQAAYLTGLCAAAYAVLLAARRSPPRWALASCASIVRMVIAFGLALFWVGATVGAELAFRRTPDEVGKPPNPLPWAHWVSLGIRVAWVLLVITVVVRWLRSRGDRVLPGMLAGLVGSAVLALLLCGAQLIPVLEFTSQSLRAAADGPHDPLPFSLEPARIVESVWPGFFGSASDAETFWLGMVPPRHTPEVWINSLYIGGITLWLALAAMGFRGRSPRRAWLTGIVLVTLVASFGKFSGPLWIARSLPGGEQLLGRHDPPYSPPIRFDGHLRDGDGSVYGLLCAILPGFGSFRYPSKLLTLTCLAMAMLAGMGWDRLSATEHRRRVIRWAAAGFTLSLLALACVWFGRQALSAAFQQEASPRTAGLYGPFDAAGAYRDVSRAILHGALATLALLIAALLSKKKAVLAGLLILVAAATDLGMANRGQVITVPQSLFEEKPEVLELIEAAERADPAPDGLFRVYRMPVWSPHAWSEKSDRLRHEDFVRWERRTIQPKYAVPYGLQYSLTKGVAELYDYEFFFTAFERAISDPTLAAQVFGDRPEEKAVVYTRRGIDLWNSRYFVLPYIRSNDESRGIIAFLSRFNPVAPLPPKGESDAERLDHLRRWGIEQDWQILRNEASFPRAWVVHDARFSKPITGLERKDREAIMYELLYPGDLLWTEQGREVMDAREMAWIETDDRSSLQRFLSRRPAEPSEAPRINRYEAQRVELEVNLNSPGIVVLADVYYPGWRLTIDGQPAAILRTNRLMRGAAVLSGKHKLVYEYIPESFQIGLLCSGLGFAALVTLFAWSLFRPARASAQADSDVVQPEMA